MADALADVTVLSHVSIARMYVMSRILQAGWASWRGKDLIVGHCTQCSISSFSYLPCLLAPLASAIYTTFIDLDLTGVG